MCLESNVMVEVNSGENDWEALCRALCMRDSHEGATHALVVSHAGEIVHEWYGPGHDVNSTLISWSIAKSITHALVGIAVKQGILSPAQKNLRPEWSDDARAEISLDDLLSMRSGLAWVEDYVDDRTSDVIAMLFGESDFVGDHARYAAAKPLLTPPGQQWVYSSGTTNIVSWVLGQSLDCPIQSFIQTELFDPLEMTSATAKCDATGTFVGSSFVYATARDFVRFGQMYLNNGIWANTSLVSPEWVTSAREFVAFDPDMSMSYGRHWWMWPSDADSVIAHGYQGQILWVSPRRDLVVCHLGNTDAPYGGQLRSMVAKLVEAFPISNAGIRHDGGNG